jgi:hypothetical protein
VFLCRLHLKIIFWVILTRILFGKADSNSLFQDSIVFVLHKAAHTGRLNILNFLVEHGGKELVMKKDAVMISDRVAIFAWKNQLIQI